MKAYPRTWSPADGRKNVKNFLQHHVPAAQDVSLSDPASFGSEPMAQGHAFHRNQVQAGFNVGGHATAEKIKNNAPCGSRLPVPRTNRRGGIYNDGGQAVADRRQYLLLGKVLGTLVMPDHLLQPRFP